MTEPHLAADFHFLTIEQGGSRTLPIYNLNPGESVYRPFLQFKKSDWNTNSYWSVVIEFPAEYELIRPGDNVPCTIDFVTPHPDQWHLGMELLIRDGYHHLVAVCTVTQILSKSTHK